MRATQFLKDRAKETVVNNPDIGVVEIKECPNFYVVHPNATMIDKGIFIDAFTYNRTQYRIYKK